MTPLTLTPGLVAKAYDIDGNGILNDNLKIAKSVQTKIDTDKNGSVDVFELAKGIEDEQVIIKEGEVFAKKSQLTMAGSTEFLSSFETLNAELYKVQEPLEEFKTAEAEYPALSKKANNTLNDAKANAAKYAEQEQQVRRDMLNYARTAPLVTQEKVTAYSSLLNTVSDIAYTYKSQVKKLEPNVKAMNEAVSLNPTPSVLEMARKSYELAVSVSFEKSARTAAGANISEAKLQIAKIEVEKMIPQVQNINEKITKGASAFDSIKKLVK